jgi:thioredoxin reductase (NADPH)
VNEVVRPFGTTETLVATHGPGQFNGEVNMLLGRPTLVRSRASESGELVALNREQLLAVVQTDSELSEIIMRAFILRWNTGIHAAAAGHRAPVSKARSVSM